MKLSLEQRDALITQYMPLARSVASKKKQSIPSIDLDELRSAAYLGLVDAANRYDTDQGGFFRYALLRITGEVKDYLRSLGFGSKGSVSRGCRGFESLDAASETTGDSFAGGVPAKGQGDLRLAFDEITETLPPQGKRVMWQYYVEGRKLKEIGSGMGLVESRVSQLLSKYRSQLAAA